MHRKYTYLEGVATADVAYRAWGRTLNDLFFASAQALMNVMVEELLSIRKQQQRDVSLEDDQLDMLLFQFLGEFVFFKDAEHLLLVPEQISITNSSKKWQVKSVLSGEEICPQKHQLNVDVKAVTLHHFHLQQAKNGWESVVVLDI